MASQVISPFPVSFENN